MRTRKVTITMEVCLEVPQGKTPSDIIRWLSATIIRDISRYPEEENPLDKMTDIEVAKGQRIVRLIKKETTYA